MPLSQAVSFLYNSQPIGISVERANLRGPLVLRSLQTWKIKDKLNRLKVLTVTVFKSDIDRNNVFLERDVFIPVFNFTGIITGLIDVNDSILKIVMTEEAWHFTRRLYKIEDSLKEYNLLLAKPASLPDMLEDLIGSANVDMPILNTTEISGLISLWRLNSTPNDDKGSNNGTWTGTPVYVDGRFHNDKQGDFRGAQYITTVDSPFDFEITDAFSISFLVDLDATGAKMMVTKGSAVNSAAGFYVFKDSAVSLIFQLRTSTPQTNNIGVSFTDINVNHHVVMTYNGSSNRNGMKVYVDGILVATGAAQAITGSILNNNVLTIGAESDGGLPIDGQMDDVRVYNKELTTKEVEKLFLQTQSGIDTIVERVEWKLGEGDSLEIPNLISLWKLDDDALDSKSSNDGTITGTTTTFVAGKYAKALDFNKIDTLVNCGTDTSLDNIFTGGGTFSCIIKPRSSGETGGGLIFAKVNGATFNGPVLFVKDEASGLLRLQFFHDFGTTPGRWETAVDIPINKETFITVVYNKDAVGNNPTIFINNEKRTVSNGLLTETSTPIGTADSDAVDPFTIGNYNTGTNTFDGFIDDVRIYSRSLTDKEIIRLFDAKDSFVDKIRSDEVPATTDIDFDIKWKSYYEVLRQIALNSINDVHFEDNRVLFGTKGKTFILDRDDKIYEKLSTKIDLDTYGDIVHVVGAEVGGTNVHASAQTPETDLLYNYERVVSNNNLKDQAAVDGVVDRVLDEYDSINPDVKIGVTNEIIQKYDMVSGDIIKIISNSETQSVKGFFRLIEVVSASTKSLLKLQFSKTGRFIPRISDSLDILEAALIKIHDVELNS